MRPPRRWPLLESKPRRPAVKQNGGVCGRNFPTARAGDEGVVLIGWSRPPYTMGVISRAGQGVLQICDFKHKRHQTLDARNGLLEDVRPPSLAVSFGNDHDANGRVVTLETQPPHDRKLGLWAPKSTVSEYFHRPWA